MKVSDHIKDSVDREMRLLAHDNIKYILATIPDSELAEIALHRDNGRLRSHGINPLLLENVAGDTTNAALRRQRVEAAMELPPERRERVRRIVDLIKQEEEMWKETKPHDR